MSKLPFPKALLLVLAAVGLSPVYLQAEISLETLLHEMVDVDALARWPQHEFTCSQASSYDRAKIAPDKPGWFGNNDNTQYIRTEEKEGRKEEVMMDAEGPGAIVRFWLTVGGGNAGVLRIYLDGEAKPALQFPAYDLLSGDLKVGEPLAQPHPGYSAKGGGNTLYFPIPYAKHCKVTWENKSEGARYYQINYRTYPPGTVVRTVSMPQVETAKELIQAVSAQLLAPSHFVAGSLSSLNQEIAGGADAALNLPDGPHAVRQMELRLTARDPIESERTLRGTIVEMTCDGETTVWCPATDFFGSGVGINELRSWYRTVSHDSTMRCRWVMPYAKEARITLRNVGQQPVLATLHTIVSPWSWDDRSMYFHTAWHFESGLKTPPVTDWNYIRIQGRGVYAGDSLALFNPVATWYGEGDEKIWVDGESFPSHMGTGTEDYYGYSYAPKGIIQTPFVNQVRIDEPMTQGHNVLSRTRQLDGIPFQKSLQFDMELMSWKPMSLTYAATTYFYAFPGAATNLKPQPEDAAAPIPTLEAAQLARRKHIPGAIECEKVKITAKSEGMPAEPQDMSLWDSARWSQGHHLVLKATKEGQFVELEIPAPDAQPRQILLHATQAPDFGILKFSVNGTPSTVTSDLWAAEVQPAEPVNLGTFTPKDGRFLLRAEVTGAHPKSTGPRIFYALDCLVLEPVK